MAKTVFSDGVPPIKGTRLVAAFLNLIFNHVHDGGDADGHAPKILPSHLQTGKQRFEANGTWTCPEGVTSVIVSGCGGGGGGGGAGANSGAGGNGGSTSFGVLLTLHGGYGGSAGTSAGVAGGAAGGSGGAPAPLTIGGANAGHMATKGGGSLFGLGGHLVSVSAQATGLNGIGYGSGGSGAAQYSTYCGGGGGGAEAVICAPLTVVPGTIYTITIGSGGTAGTPGSGGDTGGVGAAGFLLVEW